MEFVQRTIICIVDDQECTERSRFILDREERLPITLSGGLPVCVADALGLAFFGYSDDILSPA